MTFITLLCEVIKRLKVMWYHTSLDDNLIKKNGEALQLFLIQLQKKVKRQQIIQEVLSDPEQINKFLENEKIKEHYITLLEELPFKDRLLLKQKSEEFKGDPVKLINFLTKEKLEFEVSKHHKILTERLPSRNADFLRKKSIEFQGDCQLLLEFINDETKREEVIQEQYNRLCLELPSHKSELLLEMCRSFEGNEDLIVDYILKEKERLLREMIKSSKEAFPLIDEEVIHEQVLINEGDTEKLQAVLLDLTLKKTMAEQYNTLISLLPFVDPEVLKTKCDEFKGDDSLVKTFISQELDKEERILKEHQRLCDNLPGEDKDELLTECRILEGDQHRVTQFLTQKQGEQAMLSATVILENVDPQFIQELWIRVGGRLDEFNTQIDLLLESRDYPKIAITTPQSSKMAFLWSHYVSNFNLADYMKSARNPTRFLGEEGNNNPTHLKIIMEFLSHRYQDLSEEELLETFQNSQKNLSIACDSLDKEGNPINTVNESIKNTEVSERFFQEVAFIINREEIMDYIETRENEHKRKIEVARKDNTLLECNCCYDDLLYEDSVVCQKEHHFCKTCVIKNCEIALGMGQSTIKCMADCDSVFSSIALKTTLPTSLYDKQQLKQLLEDLKKAEVDEVETCQSCDYAYIPNGTIFYCRNPDCLTEYCRLCKEPAHIPLRCNEVERAKDTELRLKVEEAMSGALMRACNQCGKKIVREDGCNKMTCVCGAMMCYVCRQPVTDYNHFNGQGGTYFDRCPLWSNQEDLHVTQVRNAGIRVRDDELLANSSIRLVHDPTEDL